MKEWERRSFLRASKTRTKIVEALLDQEKTPKDLAKETGVSPGNVSRALGELVKAELVVCLTPDKKKGRYYQATKLGETTFDFVTSALCPKCRKPLVMSLEEEEDFIRGRCMTSGCSYREGYHFEKDDKLWNFVPGIAKVKKEKGNARWRYVVEKK